MAYNQNEQPTQEFEAIRLKLASPDEIHEWSFGEITRPETINYRTQKPEKDGLFCEKIFGPSKDWECYCGKYKRIRYKGIVCDKCGVEVTRSIVRRERMGHIELAVPVSHIWFLRGVPSKVGLMLDMSVQTLEKVVYFANFVITEVNDELKEQTLKQIDDEAGQKKNMIKGEFSNQVSNLKQKKQQALQAAKNDKSKVKAESEAEQEMINLAVMRDERIKDLEEAVDLAKKELKDLKPLQVISESKYQDLAIKYGHVFEASIGAEAIKELLTAIDLEAKIKELEEDITTASKNQKSRLIRRLKLFKNLKKNDIKPDSMILTVLPVIPPDLRPMVQLDGGRFAASDLNDLYRRVINRNNRLKRLKDLNAPEVIQRNEKRMLQEAVDALIDNSARHGKTVTASTGQKRMLKSLADMLKGKQGRFRQNLLGKRVDYSGRSVIVVGPHLKLHQCGLPKKMALELFKPFVISKLIEREYVYNVRSANRFIESGRPEIWDILEEIIAKAHVLLNRAPTLHRLGIQAFQPILIEGKAIQVHPLVCPAFNADFDGDQMAVHVPLTEAAKKEAAELMLSSKNLLKPATGEPVVTPSQDIVLGSYYMTQFEEDNKKDKELQAFSSTEEALMSYRLENISLRQRIKIRIKKKLIISSVGRIIFNQIVPEDQWFVNDLVGKKELKKIIAICFSTQGQDRTVQLLDDVKDLCIKYVTKSGLSWGMSDTSVPEYKNKAINKASAKVEDIQGQYEMGLLTDEERRARAIEIWTQVKNDITEHIEEGLDKKSSTFQMIDSGARGSWGQLTQVMGMKGLVINPAGDTMELPVKTCFREGLDVLEYFISTHGTRKGLSDTALRTASAGYLTRRLVDVAQDVVVAEEDCGTKEGLVLTKKESEEMGENLAERVWGRTLSEDVVNPKTKKVVLKTGEVVDQEKMEALKKLDLDEISIRSVMTCHTNRGTCQKCYGFDLGYNEMVKIGTAAGIIAAQSIGEPGTQLTMRTFHTGGVAGKDITQGLPRVEELFEARGIKRSAVLSDLEGKVDEIVENNKQKTVRLRHVADMETTYKINSKFEVKVKDTSAVKQGDILFTDKDGQDMPANCDGIITLTKKEVVLKGQKEQIEEYLIPVGFSLWVKEGDAIKKGDQLCEGSINLAELYEHKGKDAVQKYILKEIQYIYSSQGQKLNDKHVEVIIRQMFSRHLITESGDTEFSDGELITSDQLREANTGVKTKAETDNVLLGITKASLSTDSFLSAASFQETARVLIDAAVTGKVDKLRGLKENVIIGKMIPVGKGFDPEDRK